MDAELNDHTAFVAEDAAPRRDWPWLLLGLLAIGVAVFWRFIFGDGVLLYRDIGRDSLSSYYTDFVHLSNYLRSDGFPSWSFHIGMGQDLAYATGFLFWEPVSWLPGRFIAQALVYQHLLKVAIAGMLFFRFLQLRRMPLPVAILGSLVIAVSSYMTMGSCWYLPAEELLGFTAVLLGAEKALQGGRWLFLAVSVAFIGMINPFYLYLCALFLACYVPARLFADHGWQFRKLIWPSLSLGAVALLGVALGAVVTLPYLQVVLNSPRGSGATNSLAILGSIPIFGFESASHYITALLRPYANDLLGAGDAFLGWQNYLEAPLTYCGLVCLLLFPQALLGGTRRERILVCLFLLWWLIPTVFPWFRYLFWLFKGDYYRTFSLFSVLGLVTLTCIALRRYLEKTSFSVWLLVGWAALLIGILYLPLEALRSVINGPLRLAVTLYLVAHTAVLVLGRVLNRQTAAAYFLIVLTGVELVHFNWITVSQRRFVKKSELTQGFAVNPEPFRVVEQLKRDDKSFFRMTSLRSGEQGAETEPNEPMSLSYYGTSSYSSFNDSNYIRFLAAVEAIPSYRETDTRWTTGLAGNFVLAMFAAEKYALVEDPQPFQRALQYELVRDEGKAHLFRNAFSLPLGLGFSRYLPEKEFLQMTRDDKEQALLAVAVLDPAGAAAVEGLTPVSAGDLERELGASAFPNLIQQRRASSLYLSSFSQAKLTGDLRLAQNGILVLQTPFNPGWHAFQDGIPVPVIRADVGLLGVPVKAGEHRIELRYRNPWLLTGLVTTGVSALLLALLLWRKPRLAVSIP